MMKFSKYELLQKRKVKFVVGNLYSIGDKIIEITSYKESIYYFKDVNEKKHKQYNWYGKIPEFHESSCFAHDLKKVPKLKASLYANY